MAESSPELNPVLAEQQRAWLTAAQAGDDDAREQLCVSYRHDVVAYISSRVGADQDTAEDIAQTTMMRLWSYDLSEFQDRGDGLKPLVVTIAKNAWRDNRRSLIRRKSVVTDEVDVYGDIYYPTAGTTAEQRADDRAEIEYLIAKLAERMVQTGTGSDTLSALLLFADGYTDAEIAELQNTTTLNVRQRVSRARRVLKKILEVD